MRGNECANCLKHYPYSNPGIHKTKLYGITQVALFSSPSNVYKMAPLTATQAREDTRLVEKIRVVVHTGHALDQSDNHWSLYLLLRDGGSVRVNMATEYEETEGRLEWSNLQYLLTNSALHHWDYPAVQPIQVLHVARSIYDRNRHRYCFSGGGSGCRFWV